jgi:hypothetical protein
MMIQMAVLRPGSREAVIVDQYRFVGDKGVVLNENDYSPSEKLLRHTLDRMKEGFYPLMREYLIRNHRGKFDELALELLTSEEKRRLLAEEMRFLIPEWGGYLPVMDRCGDETLMVVLEDQPNELGYYVLAHQSGGNGFGWFRMDDLWPMVMYAYWKKHSDTRHTNGKDELPRED